jgi:hypothetical protein
VSWPHFAFRKKMKSHVCEFLRVLSLLSTGIFGAEMAELVVDESSARDAANAVMEILDVVSPPPPPKHKRARGAAARGGPMGMLHRMRTDGFGMTGSAASRAIDNRTEGLHGAHDDATLRFSEGFAIAASVGDDVEDYDLDNSDHDCEAAVHKSCDERRGGDELSARTRAHYVGALLVAVVDGIVAPSVAHEQNFKGIHHHRRQKHRSFNVGPSETPVPKAPERCA